MKIDDVPVTLSRDELMRAIIRFHDRVRHPERCRSPVLAAAPDGLVGSSLRKMKRELGGLADTFSFALPKPEVDLLARDLSLWSPRTADRIIAARRLPGRG